MAPVGRDPHAHRASHQGWPALSLYLPTHRSGPEKQQDPLRLKNLVRSAHDQLVSAGMRAPDAEAFCQPVSVLIDDVEFWRAATDGLAIFVSQAEPTVEWLDAPVPEQAVVGDRFYLRPLLAARPGDQRFFALAIDRAGCRLFEGDNVSITVLPLEGVPASLADELRYDEVQQAVQYSSVPAPQSAAGGGRPTGAIFHGHGGEKDTDKINLERYLRKVEAAVARSVACDSGRPLILLGVEYELAIYRSLNNCPSLVKQQVSGATDELTEKMVHDKCVSALQPYWQAETDDRLEALTEKAGTAAVTRSAPEIVVAAAAGRVGTLFFDDSVGPFGTFDRSSMQVESVCADQPRLLREGLPEPGWTGGDCGWDLVDLAAAETLLHGGQVHAFAGEDSPVKGVAALLRY